MTENRIQTGHDKLEGETSRSAAEPKAGMQLDPGGGDYAFYTLFDASDPASNNTSPIASIVVPNRSSPASYGYGYIVGTEYWNMPNLGSLHTSGTSGLTTMIVNKDDRLWTDPTTPSSDFTSFTKSQTAPWFPPTVTPNLANGTYGLTASIVFDSGRGVWNANIIWYNNTAPSNVFPGSGKGLRWYLSRQGSGYSSSGS